MRSRRLAIAPIIAVAAAGAAAVGGCGSSSSGGSGGGGGSTPVIGLSAPTTGPIAQIGTSWVNGAKLAIKQYHATGHLKGVHVKLTVRDSGAGPQAGVTNAHAFASSHVVAAVADMSSAVSLAEEPIFHSAGIPQITESSNPGITQHGYTNVFQLTANDNVQGGAMMWYVKNRLHLNSVAVFNDSSSFGEGITKVFNDSAKSAGVKVTSTTALNANSTDYSSAITAAMRANPQAIYFGGDITPGGLLCRQARSAGFKGPFLGIDEMVETTFAKACGQNFGDIAFTFQSPPYSTSPTLKSFASAYKGSFNSAPGPYSAYGYNQMGFVLTALDRAGWQSESKLISQMHQLTYNSLFGPEHVSSSGVLPNPPIFIYKKTPSGGNQLVTRVNGA
jgi:branched-chain amino acid transport system substrate-binding protein